VIAAIRRFVGQICYLPSQLGAPFIADCKSAPQMTEEFDNPSSLQLQIERVEHFRAATIGD
jgi:hypothetical protein